MTCGRTFVEIEKPTGVRTDTNGRTITWSTLCKSFADMKAVRGREDTSSAQGDRQARVETWLIVLPFRADLVSITDHRVLIDGVYYNIRSAMDRDRRRQHITMEIESGVAI